MNYTTCKHCGGNDLTFLFSLGNHYVNDFPKPEEVSRCFRVPIDLYLCRECGLVQARHAVNAPDLYEYFYWYRSGVTDTMRAALADVVHSAITLTSPTSGDVALDIGSNDGTLLRCYNGYGLTTVGVEPANNLVKDGSHGVSHFIHDFWGYDSYWKTVARRAKIVTALGMFYDLEDPNPFIRDIARILPPDGLFIAQLMCLRNMLDLNDIGNFAHEHLEYYSLRSLELLMGKHGLEIIDVQTNNVNGQSYRLYIRPIGGSVQPHDGAAQRLTQARAAEYGLDNPATYHNWFSAQEENKGAVMDFVEAEVHGGRRVWVYGASTKGNTILQYYGLDHRLIEGAADRSPEKWGRYTVGTMIPIHSEEYARKKQPDYFLVLPYTFLDEFVRREQSWRSNGGRFIVPLPTFRIV
jgi:hypothetical protein